MRDHALLDITAALAESSGDSLDNLCSHLVVEYLAEEFARLLIVGVRVLVRIATGLADHNLLLLGVDFVLDGGAVNRVGLVVGCGTISTVDSHQTVTGVVVAHASAVWAVDGDLVIVGAESVSVGIGVVDKTTLEHLVVGGFNTWDHVSWGESGLLSLSVETLRVLVENNSANFLERIVGMRPDLGDVIDVKAVVFGICDGHHLGIPSP